MKRDMDLVRKLLLQVEEGQGLGSRDLLQGNVAYGEAERVIEHLRMLIDDAKFMIGIPAHTVGGKGWIGLKLTWAGHDFLDSVRDPEVWAKTKKGALAAGGFTVDLLKDLAKGFIRQQIEERTGVRL